MPLRPLNLAVAPSPAPLLRALRPLGQITPPAPPEQSTSRRILSSKKQDWCTPSEVLDRCRRLWPGGIGLDPCSNAQSVVGARTEWRLDRDGDSLLRPWGNLGPVFCNPPYGAGTKQWIPKLVAEAQLGVEIVVLVAARVDTHWFAPLWDAPAICFWRGRIRFLNADAGAMFPSAVIYYGANVAAFEAAFASAGYILSSGG